LVFLFVTVSLLLLVVVCVWQSMLIAAKCIILMAAPSTFLTLVLPCR
jgi:hypothetical protein